LVRSFTISYLRNRKRKTNERSSLEENREYITINRAWGLRDQLFILICKIYINLVFHLNA
jgi:hypothetical protein